MILNSRIYTFISEEGLRKGISGKPLAQKSTTGCISNCSTSGISNVDSQSSTQPLSKNCHNHNLSHLQLSKSRELESVPVSNKSNVMSVECLNLNRLLFVNCLSAIKSNVMSVKCLNLSQLSFENSLSAVNSSVVSVKRLNFKQISFANILSNVKSSVVPVKSPNLNQLFFANSLSAVKSNVISVKRLNLSQLSFEKGLSAVNSSVVSVKRLNFKQISFANILSDVKSSVISVKCLNLNHLFFANCVYAVKSSLISVKRLNFNQLNFANSLYAVKSKVISVKRVNLSQLNFVNSLSSVKSNVNSKHYHVPRHGIFQINHFICHDSVNRSNKSSRETSDPLMAGGNPLREPVSTNLNIVKSVIFSINSCHEFDKSLFRNEHQPQVSRPVKILISYILLNLYYVYVHSSHSRMSRNRSQNKIFNRTLNSLSQQQSSPKPQISFISTTSVIFGQGMSCRRWFHRKFIVKRRFLIKEDITAPTQWSLSCVIELHAGADRQIRTVIVKTSTSQFSIFNFIVKLVLLPSEERDLSSFSRRGGRKC